jgi:hypothetical protein
MTVEPWIDRWADRQIDLYSDDTRTEKKNKDNFVPVLN